MLLNNGNKLVVLLGKGGTLLGRIKLKRWMQDKYHACSCACGQRDGVLANEQSNATSGALLSRIFLLSILRTVFT